MEPEQLNAAIEAILFASGDSMPVSRLAKILGRTDDEILEAAKSIKQLYESERRGIRMLILEDKLQLCSAPEFAQEVAAAIETRKPPRLSAAAMEALAVVAYFQPVTRAYIDQIRGVDSSYSVGVLTDRGLIEPCGRLEAPGRPVLYRTGEGFLRAMNLESLEQLPPLPEAAISEAAQDLQTKINLLQVADSIEENGTMANNTGSNVTEANPTEINATQLNPTQTNATEKNDTDTNVTEAEQ